MAIPWREEYELGIESIDVQHQGLVATINRLSEALRNKSGEDEMKAILEDLDGYIARHLFFEEELFRKCQFPGMGDHMMEHEMFRNHLKAFHERYEDGMPLVAIEMLGYLEGWFLHHVLVSDRSYVETFRRFGIK